MPRHTVVTLSVFNDLAPGYKLLRLGALVHGCLPDIMCFGSCWSARKCHVIMLHHTVGFPVNDLTAGRPSLQVDKVPQLEQEWHSTLQVASHALYLGQSFPALDRQKPSTSIKSFLWFYKQSSVGSALRYILIVLLYSNVFVSTLRDCFLSLMLKRKENALIF